MTPDLERWDDRRKRWILYPDQQTHHVDCERYPFESIPARVFLDTSVINLLIKYADAIFEMAGIDPDLPLSRRRDVEALLHVFAVGARANWNLVASSRTLEEVSRTPNPGVREDLIDYALGLIESGRDEFAQGSDLGRRVADASLLSTLPDRADRELLGNAIGLGCDAFITADVKTIISRRAKLPLLPVRILSPVEWWAHVKPWGGLWL